MNLCHGDSTKLFNPQAYNSTHTYGCKVEHIAGDENLVRDELSYLPTNSGTIVDEVTEDELLLLQGFQALATLPFEQNTQSEISQFILQALPDGYLDFPIYYEHISNLQLSDSDLQKIWPDIKQNKYLGTVTIGKHELTTWTNKVYLPQDLHTHVSAWYHENLKHPRGKRMLATIHKHFTWKRIFSDKEICMCEQCQKLKILGQKSMVKSHFCLNQHKQIHGITCMWIAPGLRQFSSNTNQVEKRCKSIFTLSQSLIEEPLGKKSKVSLQLQR